MLKVLYVDDQKENLTVFRITFKKEYKVFVANNVEEAFEILNNNDINVVLADHRMPDMTGIEFLAQVGDKFPLIYRIVISEYVNDEIIRNAMKAYDFTGCMGKPWDNEELKALIDKAQAG